MNHSDSETLTQIDGFWVTAIPEPYPPTIFERIKHSLAFCENCWICSDKATQAYYRNRQEGELRAAQAALSHEGEAGRGGDAG